MGRAGEGNEPRTWTLYAVGAKSGISAVKGPPVWAATDDPVEVVEVSALEAERARTIQEVVALLEGIAEERDRDGWDAEDNTRAAISAIRERFGSPSTGGEA